MLCEISRRLQLYKASVLRLGRERASESYERVQQRVLRFGAKRSLRLKQPSVLRGALRSGFFVGNSNRLSQAVVERLRGPRRGRRRQMEVA